jgi:aspartate 1-decarboxylase
MQIMVLQSKLHRATVTDANLHYEGSITVDRTLMDLAMLLPHQQVQVYNITTGARFETYVIEGEAGSGVIQINGAAAHLAAPGHLVIIAAYAQMDRESARDWQPRVVVVDAGNKAKCPDGEVATLVAAQ